MRTRLPPALLSEPDGAEAATILRACVHCGFCNATCPTYQLLGDERDGPRGRIYLIKSLLEGADTGPETQRHIDRCLTCRACESTCPSGVRYGRLLDLVRPRLDVAVPRGRLAKLQRWLLRRGVPSRAFGLLLGLGQRLRPVLPAVLARLVPRPRAAGDWPSARHARRWVALDGCVQAHARPSINAAAARLLDRCGQSLVRVPGRGCCGALAYHLGAHEEARAHARRNIDAWWPEIERGAEGIFSSATGCTTFLQDYAEILRDDPAYAERAASVAALVRDATEVLRPADVVAMGLNVDARVAVQAPCSLQHGLGGAGRIEALLQAAGAKLCAVADSHLCCGSAGAYSVLQPIISGELRARKLTALTADFPAVIATSNIGCMLHLEGAAKQPVRHWLEILDAAVGQAFSPAPPPA